MTYLFRRAACAAAVALAACETATPPLEAPAGISLQTSGGTMSATGGGHYDLGLPVEFSFSGVSRADDPFDATGRFHHRVLSDGLLVEFHGEVICLPVDPVNHRAWIGGVITHNFSTDPAFQTAIHQPGRDIWFRVVDYGEGSNAPSDRTTFTGFEGSAGVTTSIEYCQLQLWPAGDARTWPVTGNVSVRP
jgi:hypothetical protein